MTKNNGADNPRTHEPSISTDSVVVAVEPQVSSQLGDETMILHLEDGIYYGLDPVGTSIWNLIQEPRTVGEIRDRMVDEYDVDAGRCECDLIALLEDLSERRLIEVSAEVLVRT